MAKEKPTKEKVIKNDALPDNRQNGIMDTQRPFQQQFNANYDARFLKGKIDVLHFKIDKITDIIPDGEGGSTFSYYAIGTGTVYNCHYGFSIKEVGMSWEGTPGTTGLGVEIEKLPPGIGSGSGTTINFNHLPDDFGLVSVITPVNPVTTLPIQNSSATTYDDTDQNRVNLYTPAKDTTDYSFSRKDRIGLNFVGDPADLGDIESICITIQIIQSNN